MQEDFAQYVDFNVPKGEEVGGKENPDDVAEWLSERLSDVALDSAREKGGEVGPTQVKVPGNDGETFVFRQIPGRESEVLELDIITAPEEGKEGPVTSKTILFGVANARDAALIAVNGNAVTRDGKPSPLRLDESEPEFRKMLEALGAWKKLRDDDHLRMTYELRSMVDDNVSLGIIKDGDWDGIVGDALDQFYPKEGTVSETPKE